MRCEGFVLGYKGVEGSGGGRKIGFWGSCQRVRSLMLKYELVEREKRNLHGLISSLMIGQAATTLV